MKVHTASTGANTAAALAAALGAGLFAAAEASAVGPIPGATYDFNDQAATSATTSGGGYTSPGTFNNWQVQGGTDGTISIAAGIDTLGAASGGTPAGNALFTTFERTGGTYAYLQITNYYANPTNTAGGASGPGEVQASFDVRIDGAEDLTGGVPLQLSVTQAGGYASVIPLSGLANGQYVHVDVRLSQGAQSGTFSDSSNFSNLRLELANGGAAFGADAGNSIHLDNFVLAVVPVPEPTTLAALAAGGGALLLRRRRV